jgi:DNA-binding response OmpR family regulator
MKKPTILLIDDEEIILLGLSHDLEKAGYEVVTAANGVEGSRILKDADFDLVITDLMMEDIDGIGILKQARGKIPPPGVIILTGYGSPEAIAGVFQEDGGEYLFKPCVREELLWKVKRCLRYRELERMVDGYEKLLHVCPICKRINDGIVVERKPGAWVGLENFFAKTPGLNSPAQKCDACGKTG